MKSEETGGRERRKRLELPTCDVTLPEKVTSTELDHILLHRAICIIDDVVELNSYALRAPKELLPNEYLLALQTELSEILQRAIAIRESVLDAESGYVGGWQLRQLRNGSVNRAGDVPQASAFRKPRLS